MKVKGMTVQRLTSILQAYCHEGGSLDEVEIYDKEGNRVCSIEDIELKKGLDAEVCKITIHTRDIFDIEDYLKEKEKESSQERIMTTSMTEPESESIQKTLCKEVI